MDILSQSGIVTVVLGLAVIGLCVIGTLEYLHDGTISPDITRFLVMVISLLSAHTNLGVVATVRKNGNGNGHDADKPTT